MAQFKAGDRVRIIAGPHTGSEGTVLGIWGPRSGMGRECPNVPFPWDVSVDGTGRVSYVTSELAPLTPPDSKADAFIARLKRLGKEPVNDVEKVK